jgi:uncharacterized protein YceH (UPF0502 family)
MPIQLDEVELRILGVLIEKSLTQAATYPITLNAIVLGANQKQNRDPVVDFSEQEIGKALYMLEQRGLVQQAPPKPGARANRFGHNVVETFHWDRREQAVMAELILRGRQTAGELRSRASRMTPLNDLDSVSSILSALAASDPPCVEELSREPGRSANRFRHLLSAEQAGASAATARLPAEDQIATAGDSIDAILARIAALEAKVADLDRVVTDLRKNTGGDVDRGDAVTI